MRRRVEALALLTTCAALVVGCQAMMYGTASDLNKLSLGMTKEQVIGVMGAPLSTFADSSKREETLVYRRMSHTISWAPSSYRVVLRDGRVVLWEEVP